AGTGMISSGAGAVGGCKNASSAETAAVAEATRTPASTAGGWAARLPAFSGSGAELYGGLNGGGGPRSRPVLHPAMSAAASAIATILTFRPSSMLARRLQITGDRATRARSTLRCFGQRRRAE